MNNLKIYPSDYKKFTQIFEKERKKINKLVSGAEIYHIGSTAVRGLSGKGIVDILVSINNWEAKSKTIEKLKKLGFEHIHPEDRGRIFLSRIGPTKYGDTHIHLMKKGSNACKEVLIFRDFLRDNKEETVNYDNLKHKLLLKADGDRKEYGRMKNSYIKRILTNFNG